MCTHAELVAKLLANPAVKVEYDRLNASEEFFLLDPVLAGRQSGPSDDALAARLRNVVLADGRNDTPQQVRESL